MSSQNQLRNRFIYLMFTLPLVFGFIATLVYAFLTFNDTLTHAQPIKFIVLPLIAGFLLAIGGAFWFLRPRLETKLYCCSKCSYYLKGHAKIPTLCPECGNEPSPLTDIPEHNTLASCLSILLGILAWMLSPVCVLLALFYLYYWKTGGISV